MLIRQLGAELFHANGQTEGRTETTKLIVALHNFAKAHKTSDLKS